MPRICVLYGYDHTRQVIIQRQIATFTALGFDVVVVDQGTSRPVPNPDGYRHVRLPRLEFGSLIRPIWAFIRRIGSRRLEDSFWSAVLHLPWSPIQLFWCPPLCVCFGWSAPSGTHRSLTPEQVEC